MKVEQLAAVLRQMSAHESEQIHRRLSWLGSFQGFLFASFGFVFGKSRPLSFVIASLAIVVSVLVFSGLMAATLAVERIRDEWNRARPEEYEGPEIAGFYPNRARWTVYTSPENLIPIAFITAWSLVLHYI